MSPGQLPAVSVLKQPLALLSSIDNNYSSIKIVEKNSHFLIRGKFRKREEEPIKMYKIIMSSAGFHTTLCSRSFRLSFDDFFDELSLRHQILTFDCVIILIIMIILLLLFETLQGTALSGRIFTSKQVTLTTPSGFSTFTSGNTPTLSLFSIPLQVSSPYVAALSLSGYSMSHTNTIFFQASWQLIGGSFQISLIIEGDMVMGLASYNILFVDDTQSMVRLYNGTLTPTTINLAGSTLNDQYFNVYLGNHVDQKSTAYVYLTSFKASVTGSNSFIMCYIWVNQTIVPDTVQLWLGKAYSLRTIQRVEYSLILLNQTALDKSNLPYAHSTFSISASSLLPQKPANFDISPIFSNSISSNFDINCAVSIYYLFVQKNTGGTFRKNYFDIADLSTSIVSSTFPGDTIYSNYAVDCFLISPNLNSTSLGCLFPFVSANEVTCKYCNVTAYFEGPPDSNGKCQCRKKYQITNGICEDICGDGFLMSTAQYACDDGNSINGDGCSSLCETEVGYRCENGSISSPSACVYVGLPLSLALVHVRRTDGLNQGVFELSVYPPLLNVGKMNLSACISLDCGTDYQISSLSYVSGSLKLIIDYTQNLEGKKCNLTFFPDWALIRTRNSTLFFQAISQNSPLVISSQIQSYSTIRFIFEIIGYVVLGVFCMSLGHKMIGAELLFASQTACLANALFYPPSFLYWSVKAMGSVTGFLAYVFLGEDSEVISPFSETYFISFLFLETEAVVIALLAAAVILWCILTLGQLLAGRASDFDYTQENPDVYPRLSALARGLYRCLIFPVTAGFLLPLLLGVHIACRRLAPSAQFPLLQINSLALLLCSFVMSGCAICETGRSRFLAHYQGQPGASRWYPTVFMLRAFVFALLVEAGLPSPGVGWVPYTLFVCQLLYVLFLVCFRPYSSALNQSGLLFCEGTVLYSLGRSLASRFLTVGEMTEVFLLFISEGALILCSLLCLIRLMVTYHKLFIKNVLPSSKQPVIKIVSANKSKRIKSDSVDQDIDENLCKIVKNNFLQKRAIQINENPNKKQKISEQKQIEEQEDQLTKIKKRLLQNLLTFKQKNIEKTKK